MASKKSKNRRRRSAKIETSAPTDPDPRQDASLTSPAQTETSTSTSQSRSSDLAWLLDAFSSLSVDQIESVYDEAGCDPFKAAGILGTHLEEEEEGRDRSNLGSTVSVPYSQKKVKKARPRHVAACGMVSNVVNGKGSGSSSEVELKSSCSEVVESKYNYNADEAEAFLCSMLGENSFGMALVRDVLEEWKGDVEKALESLLELSDPSYHPAIGKRNVPIAKNVLDYSRLFGGIGCKSPQQNNTTSLQLNVRASDREKQFYFDRTNREEREETRQERHRAEQTILEGLFNQQEVQKLGPPPNDWRKLVKDLQISEDFEMQKPKNSKDPSNEGKKDAYIHFRTGAEKNKDLMKAYYQRATAEYSKGNHSHASCLAEKGHYYRDLARQEDERASLEIFGARNQAIRNIVTIDLHGQHVQEAVALLKRHLLLFSCVQSVHFLRVITGVGQKGKINGAVKALASRENLEFKEENSGAILLNIQGKKRYSFTDSE